MSQSKSMTYLFFDKREPDCLMAATLLAAKGVAFARVPSLGLAEPRLVIGMHSYTGLEAITRMLERGLPEERVGEVA